MNEIRSNFFRLPRELRDVVYNYYVWEDEGYLHCALSGRLRHLDGRQIDLALNYTCKTIAEEMKGLALRINKISFRTALSSPCAVDQHSDASLFEHFLEEREAALTHIVSWGRTLITPRLMEKLIQCHPNNHRLREVTELDEEEREDYLCRGRLPGLYKNTTLADLTEQADLIANLASHPNFKRLTSKEYLPELWTGLLPDHARQWERDIVGPVEDYIAECCQPSYDAQSQDRILEWMPEPWWMPNNTQLMEIAQFLRIGKQPSKFDSFGREWRKRKYFSAAAAAIQFISQLSPRTRVCLRKIVLEEDHPSVALPACHAQGLIPFCQENPKLSVERRINIWEIVGVPHSGPSKRCAQFELEDIVTWIHEARILHELGMPTKSFVLVLHGPSPEATQQLHDGVVRAAKLNEAVVEVARQEGTEHWWVYDGVAHDFPQIIKQVLNEELPVRFDTQMGAVWDLDDALQEQYEEGPEDFDEVFSPWDCAVPTEGWEAARNKYIEEIDWTDRMDGWKVLTETV